MIWGSHEVDCSCLGETSGSNLWIVIGLSWIRFDEWVLFEVIWTYFDVVVDFVVWDKVERWVIRQDAWTKVPCSSLSRGTGSWFSMSITTLLSSSSSMLSTSSTSTSATLCRHVVARTWVCPLEAAGRFIMSPMANRKARVINNNAFDAHPATTSRGDGRRGKSLWVIDKCGWAVYVEVLIIRKGGESSGHFMQGISCRAFHAGHFMQGISCMGLPYNAFHDVWCPVFFCVLISFRIQEVSEFFWDSCWIMRSGGVFRRLSSDRTNGHNLVRLGMTLSMDAFAW